MAGFHAYQRRGGMTIAFEPHPPLIDSPIHPSCCASVIVPARNEEDSLPATLDALAKQVDANGHPLDPASCEVLLLLNNCTDASAEVAVKWSEAHPETAIHIVERSLSPDVAHVGTARRLLMDTAWHRLHRSNHPVTAILSTDSDTLVDSHWIANNLTALAQGADAVGGVIGLKHGEFESLPTGAQRAYRHDRRFQRLVAEFEDLLDPQEGDPWPRHLEHFGASLACTPKAYAQAGGMPPVKPLEDIAFVDALRRSNAKLRHDPSVIVYTSARLDGRAEIGLSHQLRLWQQMSEERTPHRVPTVAALAHRFQTLRTLRDLYQNKESEQLSSFPDEWPERLMAACHCASSIADYLTLIDCNRLIDETFRGRGEGSITQVNRNLSRAIAAARFKTLLPPQTLSLAAVAI
jgi:glycosyltransferase involved in cell wall biosynthesis